MHEFMCTVCMQDPMEAQKGAASQLALLSA